MVVLFYIKDCHMQHKGFTVLHKRQFCDVLTDNYLRWPAQVERITIHAERGRCLQRLLSTMWQSSTSTSGEYWALARPGVSKLLTRSQRMKWYILPSSTGVFPLHWQVFGSSRKTTRTEAGGFPLNFNFIHYCLAVRYSQCIPKQIYEYILTAVVWII